MGFWQFLTIVTVKNYFWHDSLYLSKTVSKTIGVKNLTTLSVIGAPIQFAIHVAREAKAA